MSSTPRENHNGLWRVVTALCINFKPTPTKDGTLLQARCGRHESGWLPTFLKSTYCLVLPGWKILAQSHDLSQGNQILHPRNLNWVKRCRQSYQSGSSSDSLSWNPYLCPGSCSFQVLIIWQLMMLWISLISSRKLDRVAFCVCN